MADYPRSEVRDGMHIDWDVPIEMDDGLVLRADVYRPPGGGESPVIMTYGPYGKWLHFDQIYQRQLDEMLEAYPEIGAGTSLDYLTWETVDPEKWVPDGYAVVRVDSRGAGRSPGELNVQSPRETADFAACIEWAADQEWSNGKVGLNGISYFALNQWRVAAEQPEPLAAICVWEGMADRYRDGAHHGGIYTPYAGGWFDRQVVPVQHGQGENGFRSPLTGDPVAGPETLTAEELEANRSNPHEARRDEKLVSSDYWQERIPDFSRIEVPLLSAGNWGGHGLHLRGNVEGYLRAASEQKWLEIHGEAHWTHFYTAYGRDLQKRFFGHFLKGEETGWEDQPPVQLQVRHPGEEFVERHENEWPLARTDWTRYFLLPEDTALSTEPPAASGSIAYGGFGDGLTFLTEPLESETEITGPISAKLFVSADTEDADLFVVVRAFTPDVEEVVFQGAVEPHKPLGLGWLRASHRKLDPELSTEWRPVHTHDERQPLDPGEVYELDVEVWPTCIVLPPGYRIGVSVRGRDYRYPGVEPSRNWRGMTGVGSQTHDSAADRPPTVFDNEVTLHAGPERPSSLLLPVVPRAE